MYGALADQIVAAVEHVERLWPHNGHLSDDTGITAAIFACDNRDLQITPDGPMTSTTAWEYVNRVEMVAAKLKFCDDDVPALFLEDALAQRETGTLPPLWRAGCQRCMAFDPPVARVWVPCGSSAIDVQVCGLCRIDLVTNWSPVVWS